MAEALTGQQRVAEELDARLRRFRFETHLTALYVNPNDACHADCRYCYLPPEIRRRGPRMDRSQLQVVLERAADYFSRQNLGGRKGVIIFHGSEPHVVKDLVFWAIREYGQIFSFGLQTYGVLLNEDDVAFLKGRRVSVGISLDSPDARLHSYLRRAPGGEKAFERTAGAIEAFDGDPGLNVVTTITSHNVHDLAHLISFLHERKVPVAMKDGARRTVGLSEGNLTLMGQAAVLPTCLCVQYKGEEQIFWLSVRIFHLLRGSNIVAERFRGKIKKGEKENEQISEMGCRSPGVLGFYCGSKRHCSGR